MPDEMPAQPTASSHRFLDEAGDRTFYAKGKSTAPGQAVDTVYKYSGAHGLKILCNLELKVTPPNQFNDPFEFTPKMICSDPVRYARQTLEREANLKIFYEMLHREKRFLGNFQEFQETAKKEMPKWVAILAEAPQHTSPLIEKEFLDEVSKKHGVLCLSQNRNSILMWGHYCGKPLGLVIGFDKSSAIFRQGKGLRPVTYVEERIVCDACWKVGSSELLNYEEQIIFCKSCVWNYEAELRQFFALSSPSLTKKPLEDKDKNLGYFLSFPPESIVSVTLGPRCSPELESEVREILQNPCFSKVKLDRAVLHKNNFILEFE